MSTPTPTWGRVQRGVVWHLLTVTASTSWPTLPTGPSSWCGADEPFAELTDLRPPRGARACPRCCAALADYANEVDLARMIAGAPTPLAVEDVGLLAALPEQVV